MSNIFSRTLKVFLVVSYETIMRLVMNLPRFSVFLLLKKWFLIMMGAKIGKGVVIYSDVWIAPGRNLIVGDEVDLAKGVLITTSGGVKIGDRTLIGYGTQILSANHRIPRVGERIPVSGDVFAPVTIGSDCWIGAGCIILPGVSIGDGAIVGAGSVVTKNVEENAIAAGVPAKLIRMREK